MLKEYRRLYTDKNKRWPSQTFLSETPANDQWLSNDLGNTSDSKR